MSGTIGRKRIAPPPRKPSPPRENAPEELTFKQKIDEIKRMRSSGAPSDTKSSQDPGQLLQRESNEEPIVPKQVKTLSGIKTFLKSFGSWVEVVSKTGKVYYYNKKTQANQWKKPEEWLEEEKRLNPPVPTETQPAHPPEPPEPSNPNLPPEKLKVKMKLKTKKRVITKRPKKMESKLPLAYQKNPVNKLLETSDEEAEDSKEKLTIENAFEDPEDDLDKNKLARLDKQDEIGHLDIKLSQEPKVENIQPDVAVKADKEAAPTEDKDVKKFSSSASGMNRANNLAKGSAPEMAFLNINKVPETTAIYGEQATNLNSSETGNSTYFGEYNLPCCLKRCKFPKEQDVIHELKINKLKKRNFYPSASIPGLDPKLAYLAEEAEMEQFYIELKNYNTHDRLLTSRMGGTLVYKVPDEVWDRYVHKFQVKIFSGVYLECKPSGYSHNDELIYSRTGKACGYKTFPEDEVRCQAVLQAWNKEYCLCVYANKIFKVKRDDDAWHDVLREVRRFLEKNGF